MKALAIHALEQLMARQDFAMLEWPIQNPLAHSEAGRATSRRHGAGFGFCKGLMCKEVQVEQVCEPFADAQGTNVFEHLENEKVGKPPLHHCIVITGECIFLISGDIVLTKSIIARKTRISRRLC